MQLVTMALMLSELAGPAAGACSTATTQHPVLRQPRMLGGLAQSILCRPCCIRAASIQVQAGRAAVGQWAAVQLLGHGPKFHHSQGDCDSRQQLLCRPLLTTKPDGCTWGQAEHRQGNHGQARGPESQQNEGPPAACGLHWSQRWGWSQGRPRSVRWRRWSSRAQPSCPS